MPNEEEARLETIPDARQGLLVSLRRLSDDELVARLKGLAARERRATAVLVAHLAELDTRDVYLRAGYSSLFAYCRLCGAPHKRAYVAAAVMWRSGTPGRRMPATALASAT